MKKNLFFIVFLFANISFAQTIYTSDGALNANRVVTLGGRTLNFVPATASPTVGNFFMSSSGNIGLGTTSPLTRFHMNSGDLTLTSGKLLIGTSFVENNFDWGIKSSKPFIITNANHPLIQIKSTATGASSLGQFVIATADYNFSNNALKGDVILRGMTGGSFIMTNELGGNLKFATKIDASVNNVANVHMIVTNTGDIGIGTLTPDAKLAVNGIIHTKEVKVDLIGWPDYVFNDNYKLPTLEEVENQIKENGHLLNIPSAKEVEENGVKLGEMNKLLLQKIEEMTLYMIAMKKELQEVKSQLNKD